MEWLQFVFGLSRSFVGITTWISPGLASQIFGLEPLDVHPSAAFVARLFGIRDFLFGSSLLALPALGYSDETIRVVLTMGLIADTFDTIGGLIGREGIPVQGQILGIGGAFFFAILGVILLRKKKKIEKIRKYTLEDCS
eukprot:TRINITY_DN9959_c0_g1_i1.p1 TRINITY_DN9959_c0_g1~~TRINITY_DN9959_c0_g1_i1.p1  ORF type:complete len:139 (-),score=6.82 TRINITY_DN9959_c0_g1_i1:48-464(-)